MPTTFRCILASGLILVACDDPGPSTLSFTGEWTGQYAGSNVALVITDASPQNVAGHIAFSDNFTTGGCGGTTAPRPLQEGHYYPDSLVFGIPVAAGTTPTTVRGRVRYSGTRLKLKIQADPEIPLVRC